VVESYLRYYASASTHTARAKRLDLNSFLKFLSKHHGIKKAQKLTVQDWDFSAVQCFVEESLRGGVAPASVARRLATLKHMGRTLAEQVPGFTNPAREVKFPKLNVLKPKGLASRELAAIRENAKKRLADRKSFNRFRNWVIFELMLDTGLRADEIRLLKLSQLDESLNWIKNVRTKGRRYRNVYITSKLRPLLKDYLEKRTFALRRFYAKLNQPTDRALPLFVSTYNAVPGEVETFLMGTKTLYRAIRELSAETRLHPHLLRHSFALDLLSHSNDVRLVAQALGHSDVRTTMRYTERREEEVARALEKARRAKA
jgi:site-specific recombinase XerD